jgi:hypothetical protein
MAQITQKTTTYQAQFVDKGKPSVLHTVFMEASKEEEKLAYQTNYDAAFNNDFYKLPRVVSKYEGDSKTSTLLLIDGDELIQKTVETRKSTTKLFIGANRDGYAPDLVSHKFETSIVAMGSIEAEIRDILESIGMSSPQNIQMILTSLLNAAESDFY